MPGNQWENAEPENKNLEELRNGLALENIMLSTVMTTVPTLADIGEGQFRMYFDGSNLYKYTRYNNQLFLQPWVAA